jgi:hypothetical protein
MGRLKMLMWRMSQGVEIPISLIAISVGRAIYGISSARQYIYNYDNYIQLSFMSNYGLLAIHF